MRVRESKPSAGEVIDHYGLLDGINLIAATLGFPATEVVRWYLSKVGTWRQGPQKLSPLQVRDTVADVEADFWLIAFDKIDGAPDWLREEFIVRWSEAIQEMDLRDPDLLHAVLTQALKVDDNPRENLP